MWKATIKNKKLILAFIEMIIFLVYAIYAVVSYSDQELVFVDDDMQVMDTDRNMSPGFYLDTSYESAKAVVSPAFSLDKGIYYITASYRGNGIIRAGLIYDADRNRSELVEGNEFYANPEDESISYRVRINDNSPVRFKIRLTGDAVDGDYVQLLSVQVVSSRVTYVYFIVSLAFLLCFINLLIYGYFRYYKRLSSERQLIFIILSLTAFFTGLPLYQRGLANAIDLTFHLQRIEGVYLGLLSGQFPVKIQPGWLDGNGYAASVFYGDILLYFPAVLRMVGFTVQEAYKIYAEVVNIATVWIAFYSFRKMTKDDLAAMTGAVLYACSAKRLDSLYIAMVGAYSGMMFYPLIIAGFYLLFTEDVKSKEYKKLWILLTVGFSGLLMTHLVSCLMVGAFSFFACLLMIKCVIRRETIIELCKAVSVSVLVNLWFLVPFLQYMRTENLYINSTLNRTAAGGDYYSILADYTQDGQTFYGLFTKQDTIGYAILLVILVYLVTIPLQKKSLMTKRMRVVFLYTVFIFWVCMIYFPTVKLAEKSTLILRYLLIIQHQDRFMCVAVAMTASFGALFVASKVLRKEVLYLFVGLLCCVNLYETLQYFTTVETKAIYLDGIDLYEHLRRSTYDYGIVNAEYLPQVTDMRRLTKEIQSDEMLEIVECRRKYLSYEVSVANDTAQEKSIQFPVLYYSGYQSYDLQSKAELATVADYNGCVEVKVPAGYEGTFRMTFREPVLWRVTEIISLLTFIAILYFGCKYYGTEFSINNKAQKGE